MSNLDTKYLRKVEFPLSAREALVRIEQILMGRNAPSNKQLDIAIDLIAEFIFCEIDRRGVRRSTSLNPLQELQLIDVISDFYSGNLNETTKNTIFLSLFGGNDTQKRIKLLCKLASMAISALNIPVLLAIGTWLQQTGCSSPCSLQLAESLIRDHFKLHPSNEHLLKKLANIAPQFVANFMTAITEIYLHGDLTDNLKTPPKNLLYIITTWVCSNPKLCMSAQLNPAALPIGGIPMAAVTPLAGLIQWCALAPLWIHLQTQDDSNSDVSPSKKIKTENGKATMIANERCNLTELDLYKKLHVGVLHSLGEGKRSHGPPTAVSAQHLAAIVQPIQCAASKLLSFGSKLNSHSHLQDCLDRLGQATQVALASGCVYGNISNLLSSLDTLPENRLLRIVIKTHQQST